MNKKVLGSFMFTDIYQSSKLWSKYENQMAGAIEKHDTIIRVITKKLSGIVVKSMGDAAMLFFEGEDAYKRAIVAGLLIQKQFEHGALTLFNQQHGEEIIQVRIGICHGIANTHPVYYQDKQLNDYFGTVVNTASRMESKVAKVGEIAVSFIPSREDDPFFDELSERGYNVDIVDYKEECPKTRWKMQRSKRLIGSCKSVEDLHGVPPVRVFIISPS